MNNYLLNFGYRLALLILGLAVAASPVSAQDDASSTADIVVIGEVQGAANTVAAFLKHLGLIDSELHWSGGDTILIQTGDLLDGGEKVRDAMDLFMRIQKEAAAAGGGAWPAPAVAFTEA